MCLTVEVLVERPGVPVPTFEQLATAYVELARLGAVQDVVDTAASSDHSSSKQTVVDLFGVGTAVAPIVSQIVPLRCVTGTAKITLPKQPGIDHIIAAHRLDSFVMRGIVYFESKSDDTFDAASTHTENHGTVAVGANPLPLA